MIELICLHISIANSFKNEITNKLFTYKSYVYSFKCVQTNNWCWVVVLLCNTWNHLTAYKRSIVYRIICVRNTWNYLTVNKKWSQACLKMLSTKCTYKSYIFNIYA